MAIDESLVREFRDKLWRTVFDNGTDSLLSPWQISRNNVAIEKVREMELHAIKEIEADVQDILSGKKIINSQDKLVVADDFDMRGHIGMSNIIEQDNFRLEDLIRVPNVVEMISDVDKAIQITNLRQTLNIRRMALLAEIEGEELIFDKVAQSPVDTDWLVRWQDAAKGVYTDLRSYWARMLAGEVVRPGSYSIRCINFLHSMSSEDAEYISIASRLSFGNYIYSEPATYFSEELHFQVFESLEELGLLQGVMVNKGLTKTVTSVTSKNFRAVMACNNKALFLEAQSNTELKFEIFRITKLGQEIMSLCPFGADMGYLLAVANSLKVQGFEVRLGDWMGVRGTQGLFSEKMEIK